MLITLLLLSLSTAKPQPVFADYAFVVPIRIENMRSIESALLSCNVWHIGSTPTERASLGTPGSGQAAVPVRDGGFTGNVTVTVEVTATALLRGAPTHYGCNLYYSFRAPDGSIYRESVEADVRAAAYTRITGQAISENSTVISLTPLPSGD